MLRVFIGYDPRQPIAYHIAAHSVMTRASQPVAVSPLILSQLPITRRGLTAFTYSRFLVPYLSGFEGQSLFLDADVLCLADVIELLEPRRSRAPVHVVPHQRTFERPSVMLFDNATCRQLTPAYVEDQRHPLFDLAWAGEIGALEARWNHLVGYDPPRPDAKLVHFTQGIPVWPETAQCEYAEAWHADAKQALSSVSFGELMGSSVHPVARAAAGGGR